MAGAIRICSRLLNIRRELNNKGCYLRRTTLVSRRRPIKLLVRQQSRELFPDEQLSRSILGVHKKGHLLIHLSLSARIFFVIPSSKPECSCRWRLREEMGFDGCLRAFSAK